jgi:nucleotide-binding universal stress UspA family protein
MDNDGPVAAAQYDPREHRRVAEAEAKRVLDAVVTAARAAGLPCDTRDVTDSQPWNGILRAAEQAHCDAIVMASHGRRGLSALLIGSETTKVLTHSKIPVLVCR